MSTCPRNVLFIICDDLATTLDRYGPEPALTPNLDRLAAHGVRFTRAYCQSPLCTPSRASLLSGLRPDTTGVHVLNPSGGTQFDIRPDTVTLPHLFRQRGYFTARSGKVFHKGVPDGVCTRSSGHDDPLAWTQASNPPGYEMNATGQIHAPVPYGVYPAGAGGATNWLRTRDDKDAQHHDVQVAKDIIRWIGGGAGSPFFLAAGIVRPHVPLVAPERFFKLYDPWPITLPDRSAAARKDRPVHYSDWFGCDVPLSETDHADFIRAYYAAVSFLDAQVGRMLDALESAGLTQQTLIVFTADHGYGLGEHGLFFKRFLYEESARVPLIIADPSRPASHGTTHNEPVELLDLFPTICDITNLDHSLPLEGRSLVPTLDDPAAPTGRHAFVQTGAEPGTSGVQGRSVRNARWAYHAWRNGSIAEELYDLDTDPLQMTNLANDPAHAAVKSELAAHLAEVCGWDRTTRPH